MIPSKKETDKYYMGLAIQEAQKAFDNDEVPVGSLVVHKNKIVGRAYNQTKLLKDPTAHAEMIALTQSFETLQMDRLPEATLYVTLEPCPMCVGAMILAKIQKLVYGARES